MSKQESPAQVYEEYLGPTIADPFTRVLLEHIAPHRGQRVLDGASGTGSVARQVAPLVGVNGRVVALDINPDMLAVGRLLSRHGCCHRGAGGRCDRIETARCCIRPRSESDVPCESDADCRAHLTSSNEAKNNENKHHENEIGPRVQSSYESDHATF